MSSSDVSTRNSAGELLDQLVADYVRAVEAGVPPDREQLLAAHPELADELRDFCDEGSSRVAFVSCSPGERSHTSRALGHGLWTSSLVQALRGEEPAALAKKRYLTAASLQAWLTDAVPTALRKTVSGAVTQTPASFGAGTDAAGQ